VRRPPCGARVRGRFSAHSPVFPAASIATTDPGSALTAHWQYSAVGNAGLCFKSMHSMCFVADLRRVGRPGY